MWSLDVDISIIGKTDTLHLSKDPTVSLSMFDNSLADAAQMLFSLRGWMDGWMDGIMLLLLLPARNKQILPGLA
jgi:hypothetical protein